jgi:ABC-type transport system involved in multi-copper enzyme maturation permease subunit
VIFWKEWRRLRGRFLSLAGFYLITVLLTDLTAYGNAAYYFEGIGTMAITWGAAMALIPAILGMDAWVGERDEGTELFLFSKPIRPWKIWLAKVGLRLGLTLLLVGVLMLLMVHRATTEGVRFFWGVRPYAAWFLVLSVFLAELVVLMTVVWTSLRAPYQSTALIVGGAAGCCVAAWPLISSLRDFESLQAQWGNFYLLLLFFILVSAATAWGYAHQEAGRSAP